MVVVNLYPFEKTIAKKNCSFNLAIENIDIGGPALLRASAKNHQRVTVLTDPLDYDQILNEIENKGSVQPKTRLRLAAKVYSVVSRYDSLITSYLNKHILGNDSLLDENISIDAKESSKLRYGENPHQKAKLLSLIHI